MTHTRSHRPMPIALSLLTAALTLLSAAPTHAAGSCPNESIREAQVSAALPEGTTYLPECMALEMVSPPRKASQSARYPNVSANGDRVSFLSVAALGEEPEPVLNLNSTYVASRGEAGWSSESTVPDAGFQQLWELSKRPSFTPDFARWLGLGATNTQLEQGIGRAYEAGVGGLFTPLSDLLVPLTLPSNPRSVIFRTEFRGASADHSHLYFETGSLPGQTTTYLPGDPQLSPLGIAEPSNTYLARLGADGRPAPVELLQRDRTGKVWGGNCGARLGGVGEVPNGSPPNGERNQGAVSADGSRTYFSARASQPPGGSCDPANELRILKRLETPSGPVISPLFSSECARPSQPDPPGPCKDLSGDDLYQGASLDQSKVYFTTNRQLANSDIDGTNAECSTTVAVAGCDLYLYDRARPAGHRLVQVSAGENVPGEHEAGKEADLYNGITAISADGSHVYFVATGVLTDHPNPAGETATEGEPNLYVWDEEAWEEEGEESGLGFLGTIAAPLGPGDPGDAIVDRPGEGLWGGQGTWNNAAYPVPVLAPAEQGGERGEEGGDGHVLLFESRAELTPNDADGRHLDVYRYDADAPSLICISCVPGSSPSQPDEAPLDVDPRGELGLSGTDFAESRRWVSEDGEEVGFDTPEGLLPGDVDGAKDGYLWREGRLFRLPGVPFHRSEASARDLGPVLSHDGSTVAFVTATPLLPQDGDDAGDVYVVRAGGGFSPQQAPPACEPGNPANECQPPPPPSPSPVTTKFLESGNVKPTHHCPKGKIRRHGYCVKPRKHHRKTRQLKKVRQRTRHADADRRASR